jgi:hypothetical protein
VKDPSREKELGGEKERKYPIQKGKKLAHFYGLALDMKFFHHK